MSETNNNIEGTDAVETAAPDLSLPEVPDAEAPLGGEGPDEDDVIFGLTAAEVSREDGGAQAQAGVAPLDQGGAGGSSVPSGIVSIVPEGVALRKKHNVGKILGITAGIIIGALLVAYLGGAIVFMNWFFPRTFIAGNDVSMMSNGDVAALLNKTADDYTITVSGAGFRYTATADDVGMSLDADATVKAMHDDLNAWAWPMVLFEDSHDETAVLKASYKQGNFSGQVTAAVDEFNKEAQPPVNASIIFDEATQSYKVKPEEQGTQYDASAILSAMGEAIETLEPKVELTNEALIQPTVFSTDEKLRESAELATGLVSADIILQMVGQPVWEINGTALQQYVRMDENMNVTLDDAALNEWLVLLTNSFDTVGSTRTYTRADGKEITIGGGAYGWSTDAESLKDQVFALIKAGEKATVDIPCEQEAAVYNGPGQRDWGNRYVDVDISEQYVRFYGDDGGIIWESACISGSPDGKHDTVPGVWRVTNKESPSKLIGYEGNVKEYETTVQYWMAFEGNAIGFHDATWQPSFGGSMYANGYGSHGCVNLSYGAAESLYGIINVGDCVVVHY